MIAVTPDPLLAEMLRRAHQALEENARHSKDTLWALLCEEFPEASDEAVGDVVGLVG